MGGPAALDAARLAPGYAKAARSETDSHLDRDQRSAQMALGRADDYNIFNASLLPLA